MQLVTLTSGAMTNRIDRLENLGLVSREADLKDRRGVLIRLTPVGLKLVDEAIAVRLEDARRNLAALSKSEAEELSGLLRKLLLALENGQPSRARFTAAR